MVNMLKSCLKRQELSTVTTSIPNDKRLMEFFHRFGFRVVHNPKEKEKESEEAPDPSKRIDVMMSLKQTRQALLHMLKKEKEGEKGKVQNNAFIHKNGKVAKGGDKEEASIGSPNPSNSAGDMKTASESTHAASETKVDE